MSAQTTFTHEESLMWLQKYSDAFRKGDFMECKRITRMLPITQDAAKILTLVFGDDYLEKEGYNTNELIRNA